MLTLRPYQRESLDSIFQYFQDGNTGHPIIILPTASGKSLCLAQFIKEVITAWPFQKILMLAHRQELIEQNCAELLGVFPDAPVGIYSAGLKSKQIKQITFAGIQSIWSKGNKLGWVDLVLIDECDLVPPYGEGTYRTLLEKLTHTNPDLKVIGMTATPFRLKTGLLIDDDGIFTDIAYEAHMADLIRDGYLSPLISKSPRTQANLSDVKRRGGEFVAADMERVMDTEVLTQAAIDEFETYGEGRKSVLVFCSGVEHSYNFARALRDRGYLAQVIVGETPSKNRADYIEQFKKQEIQFLVGCDVFTVGFNAPVVDCIMVLRGTESTRLFVQICGRGSRLSPASGKENCLVLDFCQNLQRHGPVDAIRIKKKNGKQDGEVGCAPMKTCENCREEMPIALTHCERCGTPFPIPDKPPHEPEASVAPILSSQIVPETYQVVDTVYRVHSKVGKPDSLKVAYHCNTNNPGVRRVVFEWICLQHTGYARDKAVKWWTEHHKDFTEPGGVTKIMRDIPHSIEDARDRASKELKPVSEIVVRLENGFDRVVSHKYKPVQLNGFVSDTTKSQMELAADDLFEKEGLNL